MPQTLLISRRTALTAAAAVLASPCRAFAQSAVPAEFPKRPMTLILPLAPGGPVDVLGRLLAQEYQARSGHPAGVENRTGGAGNIGIDAVRRATPDGTTLLVIPAGNLTINPTLMPDLTFDVERDFAPITILATAANLFVASPKLGIRTIPELIAKSRQTKLSYGTPGVGSQLHLAMELFKQKTGVDMTFISYRGAAAAAADVLAGHVPLCIANIDSLMGQVSAGKLKPVATTGATRSTVLPETPTFVEAGFPDLIVTSWSLWAVPTGTPAKIKEKLKAATERALQAPDVIASMRQGGFEPGTMPLPEVDAFIKAEYNRWGEVIRAAGIKPQ